MRTEETQEQFDRKVIRLVFIFVFILAYLSISAVFRLVLHLNILYTHFAYIPIILAGIWWGRMAIIVAGVLAVEIITFRLSGNVEGPFWIGLVQIGFLLIVSIIVGELSQKLMDRRKALRKSEKQLRKANTELRYLSKIRRDFLHITVHDLKSPVSASAMLLYSLEALLGDETPEKQKHIIGRIHKRLDEASSFLQEFQLFATLDSNSIHEQTEEIDVSSLLRQVVDEKRDLAHNRKQFLELHISDGLSNVKGIRRLIHAAAANLVSNAIKYTQESGRITVSGFNNNTSVRIEVEDNGIGIASEDQKNLFNEFVRARRNDSKAGKATGVGLGLSIVKKIVEMHHGKVRVESQLDKGSTFSIELPIATANEFKLRMKPVEIPSTRLEQENEN